jgi:hypothetical protein
MQIHFLKQNKKTNEQQQKTALKIFQITFTKWNDFCYFKLSTYKGMSL